MDAALSKKQNAVTKVASRQQWQKIAAVIEKSIRMLPKRLFAKPR
jgi:hypothetical protein